MLLYANELERGQCGAHLVLANHRGGDGNLSEYGWGGGIRQRQGEAVGVRCVMAASVLLSAESTVPGYAVGGSTSASGTAGNGLTIPGPASWNRSLDRAFEEAAATGCLNLSGRKLKEFPRSAANHDLTDTTRAGTQLINSL